MRLYIDDDCIDPQLIRLLRHDGHDVQTPAFANTASTSNDDLFGTYTIC